MNNKKFIAILTVFIVVSVTAFSYVFKLSNKNTIHTAKVEDVPVLWIEPETMNTDTPMVIWLDGFTGRKERTIPQLKVLANRGYLALSFDTYEHGERGLESGALWARVFANFRLGMWTIIGHSSDDTIKVLDWSEKKFNISNNICMGGFSMGGDISVVVAGMDKRIKCVAAVVSTPDWLRAGMKDFSSSHKLISQGQADKKAQSYYDRLNPLTHISKYGNEPAITFELGADDFHIPASGALNFEKELKRKYTDTTRIRVVQHLGVRHDFTNEMWINCLNWFDKYKTGLKEK